MYNNLESRIFQQPPANHLLLILQASSRLASQPKKTSKTRGKQTYVQAHARERLVTAEWRTVQTAGYFCHSKTQEPRGTRGAPRDCRAPSKKEHIYGACIQHLNGLEWSGFELVDFCANRWVRPLLGTVVCGETRTFFSFLRIFSGTSLAEEEDSREVRLCARRGYYGVAVSKGRPTPFLLQRPQSCSPSRSDNISKMH